MDGRVGVLGEPVLGVQEGDDRLGDVEPVDQVVEDRLGGGVLQEVRTVVHEQQRVRRRCAGTARVGRPSPGSPAASLDCVR